MAAIVQDDVERAKLLGHAIEERGVRLVADLDENSFLGIFMGFTSRVDIQPDDGSWNPFAEAMPQDGQATYTIDIVPRGSAPAGAANVMTHRPRLREVAVSLRYYLPRPDQVRIHGPVMPQDAADTVPVM